MTLPSTLTVSAPIPATLVVVPAGLAEAFAPNTPPPKLATVAAGTPRKSFANNPGAFTVRVLLLRLATLSARAMVETRNEPGTTDAWVRVGKEKDALLSDWPELL